MIFCPKYFVNPATEQPRNRNLIVDRDLVPIPRVSLRWILFAVLALFALFSNTPWLMKPLALIVPAFITGTYRESRIRNGRFQTRMVYFFVPGRRRSWKLERFVAVETELEQHAGCLTILFFGPFFWFLTYVVDWLLPWLGGDFILWLHTAKGKRILAWQGSSDENFQENLNTLVSVTGAEVIRK